MKVASDKKEKIKVDYAPSLFSERSDDKPDPTDSILGANDHSNICTTSTVRGISTESLRHWFDCGRKKQTAVIDLAFEASKCASYRPTSIGYLLNSETVVETESGQSANYQDGSLQIIRPAGSAISDTSLHGSLNIAFYETNCGSKRSRRDLPIEAVAILKEWLLSPQHIEHPYPTNHDKGMLMQKTGLSLKQLTNWFTNARKRIWIPLMRQRYSYSASKASTTAAVSTAKACELRSCERTTSRNQVTSAKLPSVPSLSIFKQRGKDGWISNQNPRVARSFSDSACSTTGLDEYISSLFGKRDRSLETCAVASESVRVKRHCGKATSQHIYDARKLKEWANSHISKLKRCPSREDFAKVACEVGLPIDYVERWLKIKTRQTESRSIRDRSAQEKVAVSNSLLTGANQVSMQSNETRRHVEALPRGDCSTPYRQNQLITLPKTISHDQLVVEEEVSSSSVKEEEKHASLSPASVISNLPELRLKSSLEEPRLVFRSTRRAHVRSDSLGVLSHGKRTMNIQDILASAAHNTLHRSSSTLASKSDSTLGCVCSTA